MNQKTLEHICVLTGWGQGDGAVATQERGREDRKEAVGGTVPGGRGCGLPEGGAGLRAGMQAAGHRWGGRVCVRWALPAGREEGGGR